MGSNAGFRIRLRARIGKAFSIEHKSIKFEVLGHEVDVSSQIAEQSLSETRWLIFRAGPFDTEGAAYDYGWELRRRLNIAAAASYLGIDTGDDKPTGWINPDFAREQGLIGIDDRLYPNVHGLIVCPDDGRNRFANAHAEATMRTDPAQMIGAMTDLDCDIPQLSTSTAISLQLFNTALMVPDHLAQIVLTVASVEQLGRKERWAGEQVQFIKQLAQEARSGAAADEEVAAAIEKITRVGVLESTRRVLRRLDLENLIRAWSDLYGKRSKLFHEGSMGSTYEVAELAWEAVRLSGKIVLRAVEQEGVELPRAATVHYA
jgi:hypothetical protein